MKYYVQTKWNDDDWSTVSSSRAGHQEFDDLDTAIRVFMANTNLNRLAPAFQRVVDETGHVHKYYDPRIWAMGYGDGILDEEPEEFEFMTEFARKIVESFRRYNESLQNPYCFPDTVIMPIVRWLEWEGCPYELKRKTSSESTTE